MNDLRWYWKTVIARSEFVKCQRDGRYVEMIRLDISSYHEKVRPSGLYD
jgi:hypothetical protein